MNRLIESRNLETYLRLALAVVLFILINQLAARYFYRFDLTQEKRFSITKATKMQLENLPDVVSVEVYLAGDLPAGFKRMQTSLIETLEEFNTYASGKVVYQIIDPNTASSGQSRAEFNQSIIKKGLQPTDVFINQNGSRVQKRIFVGVVVSYGYKDIGVQLFKGNQTASSDERINQSIEGIEYELANAIHKITQDSRPLILFSKGHNELDSLDIFSFKRLLSEQYRLGSASMEEVSHLKPDVLMILQPKTAFNDLDKYYLDQYIMGGGKTIFLIDKVAVNMDSAAAGTYSFPFELDLDDLLFKYGVRINNDLVQDYVAGAYPIIVGNSGDQPQIQLLQWPFFPIINNYSDHVIVKNLDAVRAEFVSSIDTVKADGIRKTVLLSSSNYSRVSKAPVYVDINLLQSTLAPEAFDKQNIALGYLLEGKFNSYFKNRFPPSGVDASSFKESGRTTSMVVIADGDLAKNGFDPRNGSPLPTGFDPFMRQQFANSDLLLNALQYLTEVNGLISARAREVIIRPLDKVKVSANRQFYQFINLALPLVAILVLLVSITVIRKRKYSKF